MNQLTTSACRYHRHALGLTQSALAKAAGSSASYVKMFESERLKPSRDFLNKLCTYFADQGIAAEKLAVDYAVSPEKSAPAIFRPGEAQLSDLDSREDLTRALLCVRHFALSPALTCEQITAALERMDENDDAILALMETEAVTGFLSDWDTDTTTRMQEAFGLIAQNYLLFRHLQGRAILPIGGLKDEEVKTIGDVVAGLMAASLGELSARVSTKPAQVHEPAGDIEDHGDEE